MGTAAAASILAATLFVAAPAGTANVALSTDAPVRVAFAEAMQAVGIAPGNRIEIGGNLYLIETIEITFDRAWNPTVIVRMKLIR